MEHRTAFVFAGGGSLGAIQVGALRELILAGIQPDFLVGASVGALNACYFAGSPDLDGVTALEGIWRSLKRRDVFPVSLRGAARWLRGGGSILESHALRRLVERSLAFQNLEDARLPVHVVATNLSGAPVCLSRGSAADAVLASSAIPIAFPSVRIGEDYLMDGAVAGNTPILTAAELGATRIIVLQTGYACSMDGPPRGAIASGLHAITLLISNQMHRDMQLLEGKAEVHVTPHLCPLSVSPFDFEQSGALIERAAQTTRIWLEADGLARPTSADALDHRHDAMMTMPVAAGGYDLVSYFAGNGAQPAPGLPQYSVIHGKSVYAFATPGNRDAFLAAPDMYLPQYEGLCAYAMSRGATARGDPTQYRVVAGRLYFNINQRIHESWVRDAAIRIRKADEHWRARMQAALEGSKP
jgi:NTE family protein